MIMWILRLNLFLLLIFIFPRGSNAAAAERKRLRPPLVEEEDRRKIQRQTHCQFGNHSYELEERWRPDLGPPFGLLYCIRCECLPVQRKRRIMSRVRCENIKNDCPKPTCDDPVLLPERCCKTCPGEDYADLEEDIATRKLETEDDDKMLKEFSALLTSRMVVPHVYVEGAARGYLTYTKRDLHYTIHYKGISRPAAVRFTNEEGDIVEEHQVQNAPHHVRESKVCGVWRKLPKVYRRLLQRDRLLVVLVPEGHSEGVIAGKIQKNTQIDTEVFGALLLPEASSSVDTLGSGGIAMIFPVGESIHVSLGFNGIFTPRDTRDVPLSVSLLGETDTGDSYLVTETTVSLPKAHPDYNSVSAKLDLPPEVQENLASSKFKLRIASTDGTRSQSGLIGPKVTCNVFQSVLTPSSDSSDATALRPYPAGFALLDIGTNGTIFYKVYTTTDWTSDSVILSLETEVETLEGTGLRRLHEIEQTPFPSNTWVNLSSGRSSSQEVEMLLTDDLLVTISEKREGEVVVGRQLRGRIRQRLYAEALLNEVPLILSSGNSSGVGGGMAWLTVDQDCVFHYQVYVSGLDPKERHSVELLLLKPGKYSLPQQRMLKKFDGEQAEDVASDLDGRTLAFLNAGFTYLLVTSKMPGRSKSVELRGQIVDLAVPSSCLPRHDNSALQRSGPTYQEDRANDIYDGLDSIHKCLYEGVVFDDGAQWKGEHEECTMCSCQRGRIVCDRVICPTPGCENPTTLAGDCCPSCGSNGSSEYLSLRLQRMCFLDGEKRYYAAGSRWHPYVAPFGFSPCAICTCDPDTLTVKCNRITCPPLTCAEKDSYRENSRACCKKCPNSVAVKSHILTSSSLGHLGDQILPGERFTPAEILEAGGCKFHGHIYPNGDEWHPTVQPFGEMKCVKCHCKDGRAKCRRQKCPKLTCDVKMPSSDDCCAKCLDSGDVSSTSEVPRGKRRRKDRSRSRRHRRTKH